MGSKEKESFVQVVVAYAQGMTERMDEEMKEANPGLEGMEKGVLAALHGFGNALLSALAGMRSEKYPVPTITCVCGEQAHYQRKRRGECKILVGTIEEDLSRSTNRVKRIITSGLSATEPIFRQQFLRRNLE